MASYIKADSVLGSADNILSIYELATDNEIRAGKAWYQTAHDQCRTLSAKYGYSIDVVCAITAAVSPSMPWSKNIFSTETILMAVEMGLSPDDYKIPTYGKNKLKGHEIALTGQIYPSLHGPKVENFFHNLLHPQSTTLVTVDRHAIGIWLGDRVGGDRKFPISVMRKCIASYESAAQYVGISAHDMQAITWTVWRRLHKITK